MPQIEFSGRTLYDCSAGGATFNPSDPWNYVASGQVCVGGGGVGVCVWGGGGGGGVVWGVWGRQGLRCPPPPPPPLSPTHHNAQCTEVTNLNTALNVVSPLDVNGPAWEAAVMVGFLLVLRFAVYLVLRVKTSGTRPS